jgi:rhodanese-related sulfurtransferase
MRRFVIVLLVVFVLPILVGGVVLLVAGRPVAFRALQWKMERRFPEVSWMTTEQLALWRRDPSKLQPVLLDARTEDEFRVSRLKGAVRIDPYKPSLRPLRGFRNDSPLVVYSSTGYRGAGVASWLRRAGYTNVQNLSGGIFAWANEGRPIFRGETPTAQVHPYDHKWGLLLKREYRIEAPDLPKQSAGP